MIKTEHQFRNLLHRMGGSSQPYSAVVDHVIDGDTIVVVVPSWSGTPFSRISLRIAGIDTPECTKEHAKCAKELKLGQVAQTFAKTLAKLGDAVSFEYLGHDKYFRVDANVTLADGRSWSAIMIAGGYARVYNGGTKSNWCK